MGTFTGRVSQKDELNVNDFETTMEPHFWE